MEGFVFFSLRHGVLMFACWPLNLFCPVKPQLKDTCIPRATLHNSSSKPRSFDLHQIHKLTLFTNFLAPSVHGVISVKMAELLTPEEKNTYELWLKAQELLTMHGPVTIPLTLNNASIIDKGSITFFLSQIHN